MKPVRIGVIGAGANTRDKHLPGFQRIPGVEVAVVCNRSEASSHRVADAFHIPRIAAQWREVVESPDVDAVMIGTWPYLHADATIAALEHGKHVLTEARMASTVDDADRMLQASCAHPNLVAQIVPAPMSLDVDATVLELVRAGQLGALREVTMTHTMGAYADASAPLSWRQDETVSGIHVMTLGILFEILRRWLGANPSWVIADAEVFTKERPDPATGQRKPVRIPDSVSLLGRYDAGARLIGHFSGVEAGRGRGEIRLNGSKACLRFELGSGQLFRTDIPGQDERVIEVPQALRRGWRVEEDFIASIRDRVPVRLTTFEDGARYMRCVDAVRRSWRSGGQKITVEGTAR